MVPRGDHDVLRGAPGVEVAAFGRAADGDARLRPEQGLRELPALRDLLQPLAVAYHDEANRLGVLATPRHPPGLKDALKHDVRDRLVRIGPRVALSHDRFVCVHVTP